MKTVAMAMALRALSRSCLPALGPTHSTRSVASGGTASTPELVPQPLDELIALAEELDLDPVVARIEHLRVGRARAQRDARHAEDLVLDLLEVRIDVVARADLVAAGAELHLGRARVFGTLRRIGDGSLRVLREAEGAPERVLLLLGDRADVLHANEEVVRPVRVDDLDDVRRAEAHGLDGAADAARVERLAEGDLDLGAALEVRAVHGPGDEAEDDRNDDRDEAERDPEPPHRP